MAINVRIPAALRQLTGGQSSVATEGTTVAELLNNLESQHPGLKDRLCEPNGEPRRFVNIYVRGEDIRFLEGLATALKTGDEVSIVPAVAGGRA